MEERGATEEGDVEKKGEEICDGSETNRRANGFQHCEECNIDATRIYIKVSV